MRAASSSAWGTLSRLPLRFAFRLERPDPPKGVEAVSAFGAGGQRAGFLGALS